MSIHDKVKIDSSNLTSNRNLYLMKIIIVFFVNFINTSSILAESINEGLVKHMTFEEREKGIVIKNENQSIHGKIGSGLSLSGSRDYIDLDDLSVMEDYTFTVSFWYKSDSNHSGWAFSEGNSSSNIPICGLSIGKNIQMFCRSTAGRSMKKSKIINRGLNDNSWYHIVIAGDGSDMILYIDGKYTGSMEFPKRKPSFNMTSLGRLGRRNSAAYIDATFDELRIYDRRLSDQDITRLATNTVAAQVSVLSPAPSHSALTAKFELPRADLEKYFGRTPKLGVYPRILFGPDELPAIRNRIRNTGSGKKAYEIIKQTADQLRNGHLKAFYYALINGDRKAIGRINNCFWLDKARMVLSLSLIHISSPRDKRQSRMPSSA